MALTRILDSLIRNIRKSQPVRPPTDIQIGHHPRASVVDDGHDIIERAGNKQPIADGIQQDRVAGFRRRAGDFAAGSHVKINDGSGFHADDDGILSVLREFQPVRAFDTGIQRGDALMPYRVDY